ncbi:MAG: PKD domain-containing protein, partial [Gammaproteobacteria bacterium]
MITVKGNQAPIADAGADQFVLGGATVTLDGTGSRDADGAIVGYAWQQTAGNPVGLRDADTASPSFQAPRFPTEQVLRFSLSVTDDLGAARTAIITVVVSGDRPVADAGPDHVVIASARVTLDGSGSRDDEGPIARYAWRQDAGSPVGLSGADTATPTFMAPIRAATETLRFILTVTDDRGLSATDTTDVQVIGFAIRDLPATTRVSVSSDGTEVNGMSHRATVSANGRYVAFDSSASDLVIGDTNNTRDVFVHDRWAGDTTRISVASDGEQGNMASEDPSISADGHCVSFRSYATNLVKGDGNNLQDVFVHDRETGETTRVSVSSDGREASGFAHALSGDGRYVAFDSASPNLVGGDTNNASDVFVHNRRTRATTRVSVAIDGHEAYMNQPSLGPVISTDGRYVAFASSGLTRPRPLPFSHVTWNVFVHDRDTGKTSLVSTPFDESLQFDAPYMVGHSFNPALSVDGRYVVFDSTSNYLVSGDETPSHEIFVRDRATATTTQIDGVSEISPNAVISGDGRSVAFAAYRDEAVGHILVDDRDTGETSLISVANDGTRGNGDSNWPALSADGRYVVFESEATNLVERDTNSTVDVFVKDRFPPPTNEPPHADAGGDATASGGATVILDARPSRDPDGSIIAYLWQQTAGTPVRLSDANDATPGFIAPMFPTPEDLSFALTVVDNRGAGATDTVVIHIEPQPSPADTSAPSTHYQRKRAQVDGVPAYTVTLTPNEPASVHFRVKGVGRIVGGARPISGWQPYSNP